MTQLSPTQTSSSPPKRPKGILKNSLSYQQTSPELNTSDQPGLSKQLSEKEITLQNTLQNAGPAHRRSSSTPHGPPSRRHSGSALNQHVDENSPRLKWDEANLYLTEQQRDSTMKITEPKTPYAKQYDPAEDEEEIEALNAEELVVDELDKAKGKKTSTKEEDIPDIDLGEPEAPLVDAHTPDSEKRVIVEAEVQDGDDMERHHGEEPADMSEEEREKHKRFEEMRRKHYEMKNVKNLLGHPEELDDLDDDDDDVPPPLPSSSLGVNGQKV